MFHRKLEVGDKIKCKGEIVEIGKILFQDAYIDDWVDDDRKYIDIEFKDTKGKYRHWKSYLDGGSVQYKDIDYGIKSQGKYYLKCYRTHEDEQYGHSNYLEAVEYGNLGVAEKRLKSLYEPRRHYQVMVVDEKGRTLVALRGRKVYYFLYKSVLTELIKQIMTKLSNKAFGEGSFRFTLTDNKGSVDLFVDGNLEIRNMAGDNWYGKFDEELSDLIKAMERLVSKPIKRVEWASWYDFSRCYYINSEDEKGSVDLYFDFF